MGLLAVVLIIAGLVGRSWYASWKFSRDYDRRVQDSTDALDRLVKERAFGGR